MLAHDVVVAYWLGPDAVLQNVDLFGEDLSDIDFTGANLTDANLTGADLSNAVLTNVDFSAANLQAVIGLDTTVGEDQLLYIYDRIPNGWDPIDPRTGDANSVWIMPITVRRADRPTCEPEQMIRIKLNHPYTNDQGQTHVAELLPADEVDQELRIDRGSGSVTLPW